jgi:hypothetical protein
MTLSPIPRELILFPLLLLVAGSARLEPDIERSDCLSTEQASITTAKSDHCTQSFRPRKRYQKRQHQHSFLCTDHCKVETRRGQNMPRISVIILALSVSVVVWAQSGSSTISGSVKDASSAAVPDAKIKIRQSGFRSPTGDSDERSRALSGGSSGAGTLSSGSRCLRVRPHSPRTDYPSGRPKTVAIDLTGRNRQAERVRDGQ